MPAIAKAPSGKELEKALGPAAALWTEILSTVEAIACPLELQWRPCKSAYGRFCLIRHRERTLLYLTPDSGRIWIAIVLGDRAYGLAMASSLPAGIKRMFSQARPYAEGRGIRFAVDSQRDVAVIRKLVQIKTTPR